MLGGSHELLAQQEVIRRPPAGLAGERLSAYPQPSTQLGTEPRRFQQAAQLQPYGVPGSIALASQLEQPELLPPPEDAVLPGQQPFLYDALNQPPEITGSVIELNSDGTPKLGPFKSGFFQSCVSPLPGWAMATIRPIWASPKLNHRSQSPCPRPSANGRCSSRRATTCI